MNTEMDEILLDPYKDVPRNQSSRFNSDVLEEDKLLIKSICPHRGILQAMVNSFIKSVVDECKEKGIRTYDRLDEFIGIVKRRTARCGTPGQDGGWNEPRGADEVRPNHPLTAVAKPRTPRKAAKGVKTTKGKKGTKGSKD